MHVNQLMKRVLVQKENIFQKDKVTSVIIILKLKNK